MKSGYRTKHEQSVGTVWSEGSGQQLVQYKRTAGGLECQCRTYPKYVDKATGKVTRPDEPAVGDWPAQGISVTYICATSKELNKASREAAEAAGKSLAQIDDEQDFGARNLAQSEAAAPWKEQFTGVGIVKVTKALNGHLQKLISDKDYEAAGAFNEALMAAGEDKDSLFSLYEATEIEED
ncbi:MAG: hypothetical protein ACW99U_17755 [Candidatus Thorarchaeota archaeon]|jgi:hypothetical protein